MTAEDLAQLRDLIRTTLGRAGNEPGPFRAALADELRTRPRLLFGVWDALRALGAQPEHRDVHEVEWARGLVDGALEAVQLPANEESRRQAAQGLVDFLARQIEHGGGDIEGLLR